MTNDVSSDRVPKYLWVRDRLRDMAVNELPVHAPIPSEREVAELFEISRMTARKAIDDLVRAGTLYRKNRQGTFVAPPRIAFGRPLSSFSEDMRSRGLTPSRRLLAAEMTSAGSEVAAALLIDAGAPVFEFHRVLLADDRAVAVCRSYLLPRLFPGIEQVNLAGGSLYELLEERYRIVPEGGREQIRAASLDADDAGHLALPIGEAVLRFQRTTIWRDRPFERSYTTYGAVIDALSVNLLPRH